MKLPEVLQRGWVSHSLVGLAALSAGVGIGYILGKRQGAVTIVPAEINPVQSEDDEAQLHLDLFGEHLKDLGYSSDALVDEVEVEDEPPVILNVFDHSDDWDYEAELSTRTAEQPYIIHEDEYMNDEMEYAQDTMTYYAGDDIMSGSDDVPIPNYENITGPLRFGHGTTDPNTVYIRNEKIEVEWEILRHHGRFEEEVRGYQIEHEYEEEDQHELKHELRKFRVE